MFCAMFFYKNRRRAHVYSPPPSASLYSFLSLHLSLLLLLFIPASASLYPRPEPDLLLDTLDSPVAVLFPRLFPAATHPFRHETVYRVQFSCHLSMFRAATHIFPLNSLYRGRE